MVKENCKHVFYQQTFKFKKDIIGIHRNTFIDAMKAELPTMVLRESTPIIGCGFAPPLYCSLFISRDFISVHLTVRDMTVQSLMKKGYVLSQRRCSMRKSLHMSI